MTIEVNREAVLEDLRGRGTTEVRDWYDEVSRTRGFLPSSSPYAKVLDDAAVIGMEEIARRLVPTKEERADEKS